MGASVDMREMLLRFGQKLRIIRQRERSRTGLTLPRDCRGTCFSASSG
ncbi:hypothetical protein K788_0005500 [Paraburkholderia caribensis MBA4]|uniref:Uncharacterized protein n=1 Tax=Paraburkholderia caribensis MBA4 TaxID=1323664 RepID=A0A0P0RFA3_9BURK|nr:hypothetical protein K788_0005500 [Paraburkholderia caribensis MBA4]